MERSWWGPDVLAAAAAAVEVGGGLAQPTPKAAPMADFRLSSHVGNTSRLLNVQQLAPQSPSAASSIQGKFPLWNSLEHSLPMACKLHLRAVPAAPGRRSGCRLLSWTTNQSTLMAKKHTLLPLLTVLFLVSYGLMAWLIVEQGRTIDSQRFLIRQLFTDSTQLSSMKGKEIQRQHAEAQAQAQAQARSKAQAQTAPSQVTPQADPKNDHKADKLRRALPPRPPRDTSETSDERRILISI